MLPMLGLLLAAPPVERDLHSASNPEHVRVTHIDLDLTADFEKKQLRGTATLKIERVIEDSPVLMLDQRGLKISSVEISSDGSTFSPGTQIASPTKSVSEENALAIQLPKDAKSVRITYATGPDATALQWLTPEQTAGKKHPLLFTQSQAIDARSWIPLQDTPGVRVTYSARIRTPKNLLAVMSAANDRKHELTGDYKFEMKQAIPAYLIALCIGDLEFRPLGPRTGVYAEPSVIAKAAAEFADVEEILTACEKLFGPYRWDRYDILIMPPSFPFGGMENPRLTFASPTALAGDKSLVSLVAHELAHSWSGNLVSNATWRDFWLNEGFTVYLERRIMEAVYGKERAEAEALLGRRSLEREMAAMEKRDQILHIDLKGRPPVDGLTDVPYEKGALFLKHLEAVYGREKFDAFLNGYFDHFAFKSIRTGEFVDYLEQHLVHGDTKANVKEWLFEPGLPKNAPLANAKALAQVESQAKAFATGEVKAAALSGKWTALEWLAFLNALPMDVGAGRMKELDAAFALTKSGNSEVLFVWLLLSIANGYEPSMPRLELFLTEQGRRKFLKPLYEELVKTSAGKAKAAAIYKVARPGYHPVSIETIDAIVKP